MGKKETRSATLFKKFLKLPKKAQKEFDELFRIHIGIANEKYQLVRKYIVPVVLDELLTEYDKVRDKEIILEKNINQFGERHNFSMKELFALRLKLVDERYNTYLRKRGIEN